jgi:hypothetical protein
VIANFLRIEVATQRHKVSDNAELQDKKFNVNEISNYHN